MLTTWGLVAILLRTFGRLLLNSNVLIGWGTQEGWIDET
jgi:hypothetical protein